jgi:hypothetical protein
MKGADYCRLLLAPNRLVGLWFARSQLFYYFELFSDFIYK